MDGVTAPLVLVAHGSRDDAAHACVEEIVDAVRAALPGVDVRLGYVDVRGPKVVDAVAGLDGAVVVPAFLASGYHVRTDLPAQLADCMASAGAVPRDAGDRARPRCWPAPPGRGSRRRAGTYGDAVVLAAAGSSDAAALAEVRAAGRMLAAEVGRRVRVGFVATATPRVDAVVAGLRAAGERRITIASWLLAPGIFHTRLAETRGGRRGRPTGRPPGRRRHGRRPLPHRPPPHRLTRERRPQARPAGRVGASDWTSVRARFARVGTNWPANVTSGAAERAAPDVTFATGGTRPEDSPESLPLSERPRPRPPVQSVPTRADAGGGSGGQRRQGRRGRSSGGTRPSWARTPSTRRRAACSAARCGANAAVRAHDAVPGQVVAVDGEDAAHQPGRAQPRLLGDLPVAAHLPGRDRPDRRAHPLDRLVVHPAIVPLTGAGKCRWCVVESWRARTGGSRRRERAPARPATARRGAGAGVGGGRAVGPRARRRPAARRRRSGHRQDDAAPGRGRPAHPLRGRAGAGAAARRQPAGGG